MGLPATTGTAAVERDSRTAAASAIVMWRGRALPFDTVPDEIAAMSGRAERERLYGAWKEALEALNPTYGRRLEAWLAEAPRASTKDAQSLAEDLERFALHSETPYFAALRRYLALVGIEQGRIGSGIARSVVPSARPAAIWPTSARCGVGGRRRRCSRARSRMADP
jgi:hypothetical protein